MGQQWFTSDLHLGHRFVSDLRGFDDTEEHDRVILDNLGSALRPGDAVWVLGDISCGPREHEDRAIGLLAELFDTAGVTAHLVAGNHDSCHPLHRRAHQRQRDYLQAFASVQAYQRMVWRKQELWLSHFPRPGLDHDDMSSRHDNVRLNVPLLVHGHLHSPTPVTGPGMVDVGVDAWGLRPVSQARVQEILFDPV
ncbi:MAG TPA: metallophosphoesterase family protein [Candidatus Corynebacterium faecigallinarum]|uniref:Metallophosphoesterase family protein n=1 Tax=Candidatus Corynebacterium faecigallinarum TaxID=2838528 RepID=A0A9D2TQV0_9CORY|nr:metallophosphoesterase family protein [Candidatus Corynebacterium faecigallinarum]